MSNYHIPVLLNSTLKFLNVTPGAKYIDCTLGGGGHTAAIISRGGLVLGLDQDQDALDEVNEHQSEAISSGKLVLKKGNFAGLKKTADEAGFSPVSGILFDLGVSSHQLETAGRGFSFNLPAPLDMRMDQLEQGVTAADLVNAGSSQELTRIFRRFGEEKQAGKIAREILRERQSRKIETADHLAALILRVAHKGNGDRTHPATRVFQALRLAVNDELSALEKALPQAVSLLETNGRLVVISFHSLEDRIVKNFISENSSQLKNLTPKPVVPENEEVSVNPRSRSGKLRAAVKI